jgi:hypothetical protein
MSLDGTRCRTDVPPDRHCRSRHWSWAAALLSLALFGAAASAQTPFRHDAWLAAPHAPGDWSREAMAWPLVRQAQIAQLTRRSVLGLLGEPGETRQRFGLGAGHKERSDSYRLSRKNDRVLRIFYDEKDVAREAVIDSSPCFCDSCDAAAPMLPRAVLDEQILAPDPARAGEALTVAALEARLGGKGWRSGVEQMVGGQMWLGFSDTWRVAGEDHLFLSALGHVATGRGRGQSTPLDGDPIGEYALITAAPECLAP